MLYSPPALPYFKKHFLSLSIFLSLRVYSTTRSISQSPLKMSVELQNPELFDPLHGFSVLSLLPRTFEDLNRTKNSEQDDLGSIQSYLKSLALKSSDNLSEQAKTILDSSSELPDSEFPRVLQSEYGDGDIHANVKVRPQERRPALGRKRARFSLRPITGQLPLGEEVSLNIGQLHDPEEFFLAFEKLEKAEKELQKQRGGFSVDSAQHKSSTIARRRRPGILGKSVAYKHRYSSVVADRDEALLPSQEISEVDIQSPSNNVLNLETTGQHEASQERELAGDVNMDATQDSASEAVNAVNGLLDELLSGDCTSLDGDGTVKFLQERLQIKPINLDKLCVPELDSLRKTDAKASLERLSRPRKALSDIHNVIQRASSKRLVETQQLAESSTYSRASPTPPKSPFSSISMLTKHIYRTDPSRNPFSFSGIDISPARDSSGIYKEAPSPHVDANHKEAEVNGNGSSFSGKFQSLLMKETNPADSDMDLGKIVSEDSGHSVEPVDDNINKFMNDMDFSLNGCEGGSEDKVEDMEPQETVGSKEPELGREGLSVENLHCTGSQLGILGPTIDEDHQIDGHSENSVIRPEQNDEVHQESPGISWEVQRQRKAPTRNGIKRKEVLHRKSLAEAGTKWNSGVRRSTRIRMRPLEYWRGERFLYGRVHESLLTVIGCKYVSPSKGDKKSALKVKSFVSDEHKELVELVSLH